MQKNKKFLLIGLILFIVTMLSITLFIKFTTPPIAKLGQLPTPNFPTANFPTQQSLVFQIFQNNKVITTSTKNIPVYQVSVKTLNVDLLVKKLQLSTKSITNSLNTYTNNNITLSYFKNKELVTITPQKDNLEYQIGIIKEDKEPLQICQKLIKSYDYYQDLSLQYEVQNQSGNFIVTGYQTYAGNKLGLSAKQPMIIQCNVGPEGQVYNLNLINHYFVIEDEGNYPNISLQKALSNSINNSWPQALAIKTIILGEGDEVNLLTTIPSNIQISNKKSLYLLSCGEGEGDCYMYPMWHFSLKTKVDNNAVFFEFYFLKLDTQYWI